MECIYFVAAQGMTNSLSGITDMIRSMDEMVWKMEQNMKEIEEVQVYPYDGEELSYNIDTVVAMRVQLVAWENMKTQTDAVLNEPDVTTASLNSNHYFKKIVMFWFKFYCWVHRMLQRYTW